MENNYILIIFDEEQVFIDPTNVVLGCDATRLDKRKTNKTKCLTKTIYLNAFYHDDTF